MACLIFAATVRTENPDGPDLLRPWRWRQMGPVPAFSDKKDDQDNQGGQYQHR